MSPTDGAALPDPKPSPGPRKRYRRKVASRKQWAAICAEKLDGQQCRICGAAYRWSELHHLVARAQGGDDVAENMVPLCRGCHDGITRRSAPLLKKLSESLNDEEYAYVIGKLGEQGPGRLFGV